MDFPSSELMRDTAVAEQMTWWWKNKPTFEQADADAYTLESQPDPIKYLDSLYNQDSRSWYRIQDTLQFMPAASIDRALGRRVLYWTVGNSHQPQPFNELHWEVSELTGIDASLLKQTVGWMQYSTNENEGERFLAQIALTETYKKNLELVDLPKHLRNAAKEGIELSEKRLDSYNLVPLESTGGMGDGTEATWFHGPNPPDMISYRVWMDTPIGFGLTYNGRLQAIVGMAASYPDELMIDQLQGVTPNRVWLDEQKGIPVRKEKVGPRGLMPLDWRRLLVNITSELAVGSNTGFQQLGIQSGQNNKWVTMRQPHMSLEEAVVRYDVPAAEMGFTLGDDRNWHKPLSQIHAE